MNEMFPNVVLLRYYNSTEKIVLDINTLILTSSSCKMKFVTGITNNRTIELYTDTQKMYLLEPVKFCNNVDCLELDLTDKLYVEKLFFSQYCAKYEKMEQYYYCIEYIQGFPYCQYKISGNKCKFILTDVNGLTKFLDYSGQYICDQNSCNFAVNFGPKNLNIDNGTLIAMKLDNIEKITFFDFHLSTEERNNLITRSESLTLFQQFSKRNNYSNYVIFTIVLVGITIIYWIVNIILYFRKISSCNHTNVPRPSHVTEVVTSRRVQATANRLEEFEIALLNV